MSLTSSLNLGNQGYFEANHLPLSLMSLNMVRAQFIMPPETEFKLHQFEFVDAKFSRDDYLIIPLESLRLGLRFSLCPDLLRLFGSFGICPAQLHPSGWNFFLYFI